ncbi:MAG TPA: FAD-dependent monooxygenase [Propionibacteriaceae bacterium]
MSDARAPQQARVKQQDKVRQIVVVGGSSTGMLAAAALAGPGREVTVVERDVFPDRPQPRPGVPQGHQAHVFLYRGLQAAEELLPGLRQELLAEGAVPANTGQMLWLTELGWMPERQSAFEVVSSTRPLLEHVVRRRTLALPHVRSRQGSRVSGLQRDRDRWRVRLEDGAALEADLVVDASGRTSRLPRWLTDLGVPVPDPVTVDARVGYATRIYRGGPDVLAGCPGIMISATPQTLRGGGALPAEHGYWIISTVGFGDHRPPRDNEGFEHFLATLADPALADLVAQCQPVSDVHVHRQTQNVRHPYERVLDWPDGIVATGDALCAFDPVYGQGITVGAIQATLLRRAAERGLRPEDCGRLQRQLVGSVRLPWSIATSADMTFPTSDAEQSTLQRAFGLYGLELARLVLHGDRRADDYLSRVFNLMGSPLLLAHPALLASAVAGRVLGHGAPAGRPEVLERLALMVPSEDELISAHG